MKRQTATLKESVWSLGGEAGLVLATQNPVRKRELDLGVLKDKHYIIKTPPVTSYDIHIKTIYISNNCDTFLCVLLFVLCTWQPYLSITRRSEHVNLRGTAWWRVCGTCWLQSPAPSWSGWSERGHDAGHPCHDLNNTKQIMFRHTRIHSVTLKRDM